MAEAAEHRDPVEDPVEVGRGDRVKQLPEGHLPVTEVTFDRAGAGSPFGDDIVFPLPVDQLEYIHASAP